jgi:2-C-methyl-D-erythritol 4-phosphate cytidylyltransferase
VTSELIEALVADLASDLEAAGVIPATNVTDTIKQAPKGTRPTLSPSEGSNVGLVIEKTLDRGRLWAAQTPQVFRTDALRAALAGDPERVAAATDEAMLVEAAGERVLIHPTGPENLKVTTPLDLRVAELLLGD